MQSQLTRSTPTPQAQQVRLYAKKGGTTKGTSTAHTNEPDPYAPQPNPTPDMSSRVPSSLKALTPEQREVLQALVPDGAPLRSLRQLGWPMTRYDMLHIIEHHQSQAGGQIVQVRSLQQALCTCTVMSGCCFTTQRPPTPSAPTQP
jgi:hypothetical protein